MNHTQTWKDLQGPRKLIPSIPLHRGREYHNSATHSDVSLFRARQVARGMKVKQ